MLGRPSRVAVPIPALPAGPPLRPCSLGRAPQGSRLGPVGSFVDDLKPNQVLYGVRAALLQRSLEIQPAFSTIRFCVCILLSLVFSFFSSFIFFCFFFSCTRRSGLPRSKYGAVPDLCFFSKKNLCVAVRPCAPLFWSPPGLVRKMKKTQNPKKLFLP